MTDEDRIVETQGRSQAAVSPAAAPEAAVERLGLPAQLSRAYAQKGLSRLYDWQAACLASDGVANGRNLVYCAPTSGGKTLVSEIIMLRRVWNLRKRAIFVLPYVSVVTEKAQQLKELCKSTGISVKGFHGGSPDTIREHFDVAVCTTEKANSLVNYLVEEGMLADTIGTFVLDELHLVGEASRGYLLEVTVSKLLFFAPDVQLVGMSATMPNVTDMATWLRGTLFRTDYRPVPLREYILMNGSLLNPDESLVRPISDEGIGPDARQADSTSLLAATWEVTREGHSALVFCASRDKCEKTAAWLAELLPPSSQDTAQQSPRAALLARGRQLLHPIDRTLERTLQRGIAFHHGGLTTEERDIVESGYRQGAICVICATSTLAAGVNLPARRVIFPTPYMGKEPLDSSKYRQMAGRAGRAGQGALGEAVIIADKKTKRQVFDLVRQTLPAVNSCLADNVQGLKRLVLEVLSVRQLCSGEDLIRLFESTLRSTQRDAGGWEKSGNPLMDYPEIASAMQWLLGHDMARLDERSQAYVVTPLGKAVSSSALDPETGYKLFQEMERARPCVCLDTDLHICYLVTPQEGAVTINWHILNCVLRHLSSAERRVADKVGIRLDLVDKAEFQQGKLDAKVLASPECQRLVRFYNSLVLWAVLHETPMQQLLERFQLPKGQLQQLQTGAAAFTTTVAVFCNRLQWHSLEALILSFQQRLTFGVRSELVPLMQIENMDCVVARALYEHGFTTPVGIAGARPSEVLRVLRKTLPHNVPSASLPESIAERLIAAARSVSKAAVKEKQRIAREARKQLRNEAQGTSETLVPMPKRARTDQGLAASPAPVHTTSVLQTPQRMDISAPSSTAPQILAATSPGGNVQTRAAAAHGMPARPQNLHCQATQRPLASPLNCNVVRSPSLHETKREGVDSRASASLPHAPPAMVPVALPRPPAQVPGLLTSPLRAISDWPQHMVSATAASGCSATPPPGANPLHSMVASLTTPCRAVGDAAEITPRSQQTPESTEQMIGEGLRRLGRSSLTPKDVEAVSASPVPRTGGALQKQQAAIICHGSAERGCARSNPSPSSVSNSSVEPEHPAQASEAAFMSSAFATSQASTSLHLPPLSVVMPSDSNAFSWLAEQLPHRSVIGASAITGGVDGNEALCITLTPDQALCVVLPPTGPLLFGSALWHWLSYERHLCVTRDAKELVGALLRRGVDVSCSLAEPRIAHWLLDPDDKQRFGDTTDFATLHSVKLATPAGPPQPPHLCGAEASLEATLRARVSSQWPACFIALPLMAALLRKLGGQSLLDSFWQVEMPFAIVLAWMEHIGMGCESRDAYQTQSHILYKIAALDEHVRQVVGRRVNLNSSEDVGRMLFDDLGLPVPRGTRFRRKTNGRFAYRSPVELLKQLPENPLVSHVLEYRHLTHATRRMESLLQAGTPRRPDPPCAACFARRASAAGGASAPSKLRCRTEFVQTATATGRLATANGSLPLLTLDNPFPMKEVWRPSLHDEQESGLEAPASGTRVFAAVASEAPPKPRQLREGILQAMQPATCADPFQPGAATLSSYWIGHGWTAYSDEQYARRVQQVQVRLGSTLLSYPADKVWRLAAPIRLSEAAPELLVNPRRLLVAEPGSLLLSVDYSQLEVRLMAHFSQDEKFVDILARDGDVFRHVAAGWLRKSEEEVTAEERSGAKRICYGLIYGMGTGRLATDLGISRAQAAEFQGSFMREFAGVAAWIQGCQERARQCGYVETLHGRRRFLPGLAAAARAERSHAERQAVHTTCQASAADLVKMAMLRIHARLKEFRVHEEGCCRMPAQMLLQIHDELLFEVREDWLLRLRELAVAEMIAAGEQLRVPLQVKWKTGRSWGTLE